MKNALSLKTERLAELTTDDLHLVHGAGICTLKTACGQCDVEIVVMTLRGCTTAVICP